MEIWTPTIPWQPCKLHQLLKIMWYKQKIPSSYWTNLVVRLLCSAAVSDVKKKLQTSDMFLFLKQYWFSYLYMGDNRCMKRGKGTLRLYTGTRFSRYVPDRTPPSWMHAPLLSQYLSLIQLLALFFWKWAQTQLPYSVHLGVTNKSLQISWLLAVVQTRWSAQCGVCRCLFYLKGAKKNVFKNVVPMWSFVQATLASTSQKSRQHMVHAPFFKW